MWFNHVRFQTSLHRRNTLQIDAKFRFIRHGTVRYRGMLATCAQQFPSNNLLTSLNLREERTHERCRIRRQMGKKIKKKKDGNSNEIGIQCRNVRETKKWEHFSLAHGCNKLNSILFSCILRFLHQKKN